MRNSPSYSGAFLVHPLNRLVALGMTAASVLASFPLGWPGMALVLLGLAAVEVVGLTIVPSLPSFRAAVDRARARDEREARRARLTDEIERYGGSSHLTDYEQMQQRVASLYRMAADATTTFGEREVEQLDDLSVSYLNLCLSDAALQEQDRAGTNNGVERKLRDVVQRLAQPLQDDERAQLLRAKAEYEEALKRQGRMNSRRSALEASLLSMPVRMEEVYQMVMTAPSAGNLSALLEESVQKLRTTEQVTLELEEPVGSSSVWEVMTTAASSPVPVNTAAATTTAAHLAQAARRPIGTGNKQ